MSVKDEYLDFKTAKGLKTRCFADRVLLQKFLKDRIEDIWAEKPNFSNGGLLRNYMTRFAIGFAYWFVHQKGRTIPGLSRARYAPPRGGLSTPGIGWCLQSE
jgi:hypothetical protein